MQSAYNIERKGAYSIFPDSGKTQKALVKLYRNVPTTLRRWQLDFKLE